VHDVTELKQTEKLKKEFVSIVSHELRTPLTSIRGSLGLLTNGVMGEFTPKVNKLLEIANSNCDRLLLLISDILDIEKIEAGKMVFEMKRTDLMDMVNASVEANKMYADQYGVILQFVEPDLRIQVNVDTDRLMQVLANLISNACKFSPKGESVSIEIKKIENKVRVLVSDKGPGVPLEFQSRIFQKFAQADSSDSRRKGGTGLGLSISRSIIERFGGVLHFITEPNKGATFYFDLPIAHEEPKLITETSSEIKVITKRLLICDDDEDQSNYLKVLLESAGYMVDVSNSVTQAKRLLLSHAYEALLLDLILPDQDGIAFIRELHEDDKLSTLRIIVISVIAETGRSLLNSDTASAINWLSKPIDFNTLLVSLSMSSQVGSKNASEMLENNRTIRAATVRERSR
jgi:CheY-like chemotaxis protein